jgi:hypothetical protein
VVFALRFAGLAGSLYPCLMPPANTVAGGACVGSMLVFALVYDAYHRAVSGPEGQPRVW